MFLVLLLNVYWLFPKFFRCLRGYVLVLKSPMIIFNASGLHCNSLMICFSMCVMNFFFFLWLLTYVLHTYSSMSYVTICMSRMSKLSLISCDIMLDLSLKLRFLLIPIATPPQAGDWCRRFPVVMKLYRGKFNIVLLVSCRHIHIHMIWDWNGWTVPSLFFLNVNKFNCIIFSSIIVYVRFWEIKYI